MALLNLGTRNLVVFLKDKTAVLLSFLAEFIIIGLYLLFLRDNLIGSFPQTKNAALLMDVWMIAGILGVTSVTTTMGAYGVMVDDRTKKIQRDFTTAPIRPFSLLGGYMTSAIVIGLVMSFLMLLVSELYILQRYGVMLGGGDMLSVYALLVLSTVSNSSLILLLVSFLKSNNALAACCTLLGALIGFLTGIYLPVGSLPQSVRCLIPCFPVSHSVALFRQTLLSPFLAQSFGGAQAPAAMQFSEYMGIQYVCDGSFLPPLASIGILAATTVVAMSLAIFNLHRQREL